MNFYDELEREMKAAGLSGRKVRVPEEFIPTPKDIAELARNCEIRGEETRQMLISSSINASNSMPAGKSGKNKSLRKCMK